MSVTQTESGNMPKVDGEEPSSPDSEVKTPEKAEEVSSKQEARFTEAEVRAAVHAAESKAGRERSTIEKERNSFKTELEKVKGEMEENQKEIEKLQSKLDDLTSDDPEKFSVAKELKTLRDDRRQLKADRQLLESERSTHAERVKVAEDTLREIAIFEISQEYAGGNPEKLKDLCDAFGATGEAQFRTIADKLWTKKGEVALEKPTGKPPLKLDSGGSGGALSDAQIIAAFSRDPYNQQNRQRYFELRANRKNW